MPVKTHSSFKQVASWRPNNGRWLATLSLPSSDIADRAGLNFHADADDLGAYKAAFVRLSGGPEFMLRRDEHPNISGTMIWGRTDCTVTVSQVASLMIALNIRQDELVETSPELASFKR